MDSKPMKEAGHSLANAASITGNGNLPGTGALMREAVKSMFSNFRRLIACFLALCLFGGLLFLVASAAGLESFFDQGMAGSALGSFMFLFIDYFITTAVMGMLLAYIFAAKLGFEISLWKSFLLSFRGWIGVLALSVVLALIYLDFPADISYREHAMVALPLEILETALVGAALIFMVRKSSEHYGYPLVLWSDFSVRKIWRFLVCISAIVGYSVLFLDWGSSWAIEVSDAALEATDLESLQFLLLWQVLAVLLSTAGLLIDLGMLPCAVLVWFLHVPSVRQDACGITQIFR
ncbi:hypothetical protein [Kordiimonas lacus]|uniref:Uncharacterized protein n=1 Tax=Kordiimonas lacus TaxID=637679 RepID=A0A1G6YDY8_9PROT|nr:hypothetical protein [Kordiimonas lacus]SDD88491.1 hypothetical protein SAMN04488071_1585 [Kordiimonas lacus]